MKKYEKTRSNIKPNLIKFDEFSVWVCENITEVQADSEFEDTQIQYEYDMIQYGKDEYIMMLIQKNMADTQYIGMMTEVI